MVVKHGKGKFTCKNGDAHDGEWQHGLLHGEGKLISKNGEKGIYTRADNTIYHDGEWENSLPKK